MKKLAFVLLLSGCASTESRVNVYDCIPLYNKEGFYSCETFKGNLEEIEDIEVSKPHEH